MFRGAKETFAKVIFDDEEIENWPVADLRVDLSTTNGVGYAVQQLCTACAREPWQVRSGETKVPHIYNIVFDAMPEGLAGVVHRHLIGQTTDADRLWLARRRR